MSLIFHSTIVIACIQSISAPKSYIRIYLKRKGYSLGYNGTLLLWLIYKIKVKCLLLLPTLTYYINLWHPLSVPTISFCVILLFNLWIGEINMLWKLSTQILNFFSFQLKIYSFIKYFQKMVAFKLLPLSWATNGLERFDFLYIYFMKSYYAVLSCIISFLFPNCVFFVSRYNGWHPNQ